MCYDDFLFAVNRAQMGGNAAVCREFMLGSPKPKQSVIWRHKVKAICGRLEIFVRVDVQCDWKFFCQKIRVRVRVQHWDFDMTSDYSVVDLQKYRLGIEAKIMV